MFVKPFIFLLCLYCTVKATAQSNWIAPEGFTINQRTLTWDDFKGKEDKEFASKLASRNLQAAAYVCPAIYFTYDNGKLESNRRVKFQFHLKCAFQSCAFVRESTKQMHSNYILTHEQDHYDIALTYTRKLQDLLSSRDYSQEKYSEEIEKLYFDLMDQYVKLQQTYDGEVNPNGTDDVPKQTLWDKRIKKCMDNYTDEFLKSSEDAVQNVAQPGAIVKRIPGEPAIQFAVRARPIYTEFNNSAKNSFVEVSDWSESPALIAFYSRKTFDDGDVTTKKNNVLIFAYLFMPTAGNYYKRILIDTFSNDEAPVRINQIFFANADSDQEKELVIMASSSVPNGTFYFNRIYDNIFKPMPGKLRRVDDFYARIESGFEGVRNGKEYHTPFKTEEDIKDALNKPRHK